MNLFKRKAHTVIMCNLVVPFVCTGFLGMKSNTGLILGNTTDEAHEISLSTSDTEPVSQYWEGEEDKFAFITESVGAVIDQQEIASIQLDQIDDEAFAFVVEGIDSIIGVEDEDILDDELEENEYAFVTQTIGAIMDQHEIIMSNKVKATTKSNTTKKTTSVVTKKEVAKSVNYAKPSTSNASGDAIVSFAKQFNGKLKYVHAGRSLKTGTDCSGFTMLIYKEFGISLPGTVGGQLRRGTSVSKSSLQKGDLVFFKPKGCKSCGASHVALYIGGGQVIHETRPGRGVAITGIDGLSNIQFYAARRIINSSNKKVVEKKVEEKTKADNTTVTVNNNTANELTTNNDEKKNEIVNNNNVVENNVIENNVNTTTTTTIETSNEIKKEEVKTDVSEEVKVEETPKTEEKKEIPVKEEKKEEKKEESKKEETKETTVSDTESN